MTTFDMLLCMAGVFAVTYFSRSLPLLALKTEMLSETLRRWLSFVPVTILSALVGPDLLVRDNVLSLGPDNIFLVAAIPTLLVSWKTKSFFGTIAVGMFSVALLRWLA